MEGDSLQIFRTNRMFYTAIIFKAENEIRLLDPKLFVLITCAITTSFVFPWVQVSKCGDLRYEVSSTSLQKQLRAQSSGLLFGIEVRKFVCQDVSRRKHNYYFYFFFLKRQKLPCSLLSAVIFLRRKRLFSNHSCRLQIVYSVLVCAGA